MASSNGGLSGLGWELVWGRSVVRVAGGRAGRGQARWERFGWERFGSGVWLQRFPMFGVSLLAGRGAGVNGYLPSQRRTVPRSTPRASAAWYSLIWSG